MDINFRTNLKTQTRGYTIFLEKNLFGDLIVTRYWYGLHNGRGNIKRTLFHELNDALKEIKRIEKIRLRRGYQRIRS